MLENHCHKVYHLFESFVFVHDFVYLLSSEYKERSLALCDQVVKELNGWLRSKNAPVISESSENLLRDQMMNIMDPNATSNPVCKLMGELLSMLEDCFCTVTYVMFGYNFL